MRLLNAHQRFRPITLERPKALLPLANVPMIEYVLEFLASNGVEEVFVFCCAHAGADHVVPGTERLEQHERIRGAEAIVSTNCISAGEALRLIDHRHVVRADFVLVRELDAARPTWICGERSRRTATAGKRAPS